nr:hypothetical protein [Tanacetum cinerariifolium]
MEYLLKISEKARILELKQRHLRITVLTSYTLYSSRKIRRRSCENNGEDHGTIHDQTQDDYGLGIARPKIDDKDHFELKGQFLKEQRDNAFSGSDHKDANEHVEKVLEIEDLKTKFLSKYCPPARTIKKMKEINNFQQEPNETLYQAWERFKELLMKWPRHYLTEIQELILFYNGLEVPTRQILDSKGAILTKTVADAKVAIQEMAEYSQKWHNETSRTRSTKSS